MDLTLTTTSGSSVRVPSPDGFTHLQFRRFAGCPISLVAPAELHRVRRRVDRGGHREVVLFHSAADSIRRFHDQLPFACIADPDGTLCAEFGVTSSVTSMLHPHAWAACGRGVLAGRSALGSFSSDNHLGLPADLLLDPAGRVVAVLHGHHAADAWSVDDLLTHRTSVA